MHINLQQNQVSRSVKTVYTYIFVNSRKSHKFATANSNFEKAILLEIHHRETHMYINFQQNRVCRSVKTVHTNLFAKNRKLQNLQLPIVIFKKSIFSELSHRKTYMYINF